MKDNKDLELYLKNLNEKMASIEEEKSKIISQIKKNEEVQSKSLTDQAVDSKDFKSLLKVDELDQSSLTQDEFWANHLKPVNKLIARAGTYNESSQISFKLSLINSSYNKDQVKKLLPVLEPIIKNLIPVKIHKQITNKYKAIPIFDFHKGGKGSYTLIINEKEECAVYCENRAEPFIVSKFMSLEQVLILISKKYYYYT